MGRRRGFFAELHHQAKQRERDRQRAERESEREYRAAVREAEQALKAEERARKAEERALQASFREAEREKKADEREAARIAREREAERKRLERETREAHRVAMEAEVVRLNVELSDRLGEVDSLLAATLDVDDYVDLRTLQVSVSHPPFDRLDLETPVPAPDLAEVPLEPVLALPAAPRGIRRLLGRRKHARAVERATADHRSALGQWQRDAEATNERNKVTLEEHVLEEAVRRQDLEDARRMYATECRLREEEAAAHNSRIDKLIADLGYGVVDAVQEYISIVMSNSVYPEHFQVEHDFRFEPETAELWLRVLIPPPGNVPSIKAYKYTKSSDEITSTPLSKKACKDRYSSAVQQVGLRSIHEVFEADRRGLIKTISLEVGTQTLDPATGRDTYIPFVATGAEREEFNSFDLAKIVPGATLAHLGAAVSKNPYELVGVDIGGVRRS